MIAVSSVVGRVVGCGDVAGVPSGGHRTLREVVVVDGGGSP